jgi:fructokinase
MILCCGEALIDMLPRKTPDDEDAFAPYPGGAVFNTAIALGRLGAPTGFLSGLSSDLFGEILRASLASSNVDSSLSVISDRPTTLAFVQLINGQASYAFNDENTAGKMLMHSDIPTIGDDVSTMFFGGISLVAEPCGDFYQALMLREAKIRVTMIDPNIRPGFIIDEPTYRTRIERMIGAADIVKISDEDLRWLRGAGDEITLAGQLITDGAALVLVTRGADGATAYTRDHSVFVAANKVPVVDTVGAGDTFNAGVLASLQQNGRLTKTAIRKLTQSDLEQALENGVRAAAITVSRAGANPPWAHEI